jgi:hypothetical protein
MLLPQEDRPALDLARILEPINVEAIDPRLVQLAQQREPVECMQRMVEHLAGGALEPVDQLGQALPFLGADPLEVGENERARPERPDPVQLFVRNDPKCRPDRLRAQRGEDPDRVAVAASAEIVDATGHEGRLEISLASCDPQSGPHQI